MTFCIGDHWAWAGRQSNLIWTHSLDSISILPPLCPLALSYALLYPQNLEDQERKKGYCLPSTVDSQKAIDDTTTLGTFSIQATFTRGRSHFVEYNGRLLICKMAKYAIPHFTSTSSQPKSATFLTSERTSMRPSLPPRSTLLWR